MPNGPHYAAFIQKTRNETPEITVHELRERLASPEPPLVIDVRELHEWRDGHLPHAHHLNRHTIAKHIEAVAPALDREIITYCGGGTRASLAAEALRQLGYQRVSRLAGGARAWKDCGFDLVTDRVESVALPARLSDNMIHLGANGAAIPQPTFTGMAWYAAYTERYAADGADGRLVSMYTFERSWDSWERHPAGSEVVVCIAGQLTLIQEIDGEPVRTTLTAGEYAINPPGVWHTADLDTPATALFITSGLGTEHRAR